MTVQLPPILNRRVHQGRFDLQFSELDRLGVSQGQLRSWVRHEYLTPLGAGSYSINAPIPDADPYQAARTRYLRRCAAILQPLKNAYLVEASAAAAYDLPLLQLPQDVHLSRRPHSRLTRVGVRPHRPWGTEEPVNLGALMVQPVAATIVEIGARYGVESGLIVGDAALRRQLITPQEITEAIAAFGHRAGVHAARKACELADARMESPGESRLRWVAHQLDYELTPQVEIRAPDGRFVARVDFVIAGTNVVIEFDGLGKYATPDDLRAEKRRQIELERLGYVVLRFTWADLDHPERIHRIINQALTGGNSGRRTLTA